MSLPVFPLIDVRANFNEDPEDVILRSPPDAGKVITRAKFTRARSTLSSVTFEVNESELLEKTAVVTFFNDTVRRGALPFTLNLNLGGSITTYSPVIFVSPPKYAYVGMGCWDVVISVMETHVEVV